MILTNVIHAPSGRYNETHVEEINFVVINLDNVVVIKKNGELFGTKFSSFEKQIDKDKLYELARWDISYDDAVMGNYK